MQWDNYDNIFSSTKNIGESQDSIMSDILSNIITQRFNNTNQIVKDWSVEYINREELQKKASLTPKIQTYNGESFEPIRFHFYGDKDNSFKPIRLKETYYFDEFFRKKVNDDSYIYLEGKISKRTNISPEPVYPIWAFQETSFYQGAVLPININPWLLYLNELYKNSSIEYKKKLVFYSGINSNGTFHNNNNLDDTGTSAMMGIAEDGVSHLGELVAIDTANVYGYLNDGPVPVTSALLDTKYSFDDLVNKDQTSQVSLYQEWITSDDPNIKYYSPKNNNYIGNGYSNYVLFMDYHHDRMKSGGYTEDAMTLDSKVGFKLDNRKKYIQNTLFFDKEIESSELFYTNYIGNTISEFKQINTLKYGNHSPTQNRHKSLSF